MTLSAYTAVCQRKKNWRTIKRKTVARWKDERSTRWHAGVVVSISIEETEAFAWNRYTPAKSKRKRICWHRKVAEQPEQSSLYANRAGFDDGNSEERRETGSALDFAHRCRSLSYRLTNSLTITLFRASSNTAGTMWATLGVERQTTPTWSRYISYGKHHGEATPQPSPRPESPG